MARKEIVELMDKLGFGIDCIVETILTTKRDDGTPTSAPMGVIRRGSDILEIKPFKSSETYLNLLAEPQACVTITDDPGLFLATAFKDENLFGFSKPITYSNLVMDGATAAILIEVTSRRDIYKDRGCFSARVLSIEVLQSFPRVFSRGRAEAIEAIIHSTRIKVYSRMELLRDMKKLIHQFNSCKEVVERISSADSIEVEVIKTLSEKVKQWRDEASR